MVDRLVWWMWGSRILSVDEMVSSLLSSLCGFLVGILFFCICMFCIRCFLSCVVCFCRLVCLMRVLVSFMGLLWSKVVVGMFS